MRSFKCLVLDHDDTSVESTPEIHYPAFLRTLAQLRPGVTIDYDDFIRYTFDPGFFAMCTDIFRFSEDEMKTEHKLWREFVRDRIPGFCPGIPELIAAQKAAGGIVCVVSHSLKETIIRDYNAAGVPLPDMIFGADCPPEQCKPSPYPLMQIMKAYSLSPRDILVIDDLKPGYEMAMRAGVGFAYASWASTRTPQIEAFMREHSVPFLYLRKK